MEMSGGGIMQAREQVTLYKAAVLEVVQCVLEQDNNGQERTATEVERSYAAMLAKADMLREQFGEMGVKRLLNMVITAAARLMKPRAEGGQIVRGALTLPKKSTVTNGKTVLSDYKLGPGPYQAGLTWPPYFEPSINDANTAVQAASAAKAAGLVDNLHAARFVGHFFQVEDVGGMVDELSKAGRADQDNLEDMALKGVPSEHDDEATPPEQEMVPVSQDAKDPEQALNGAQVASLQEIVASVARRELPRASAVELILAAFPIKRPDAERILGTVGTTFFSEDAGPQQQGR